MHVGSDGAHRSAIRGLALMLKCSVDIAAAIERELRFNISDGESRLSGRSKNQRVMPIDMTEITLSMIDSNK